MEFWSNKERGIRNGILKRKKTFGREGGWSRKEPAAADYKRRRRRRWKWSELRPSSLRTLCTAFGSRTTTRPNPAAQAIPALPLPRILPNPNPSSSSSGNSQTRYSPLSIRFLPLLHSFFSHKTFYFHVFFSLPSIRSSGLYFTK